MSRNVWRMLSKEAMPVLGRAGRTVNTSHINASEASNEDGRRALRIWSLSAPPAQDKQDRGARHLQDLVAQFAQRALAGRTGGQRRGRVLQVDRSQPLQPPPHRRAQPGGFGGNPVNQQQPACAVRGRFDLLPGFSTCATTPFCPVAVLVTAKAVRLAVRS